MVNINNLPNIAGAASSGYIQQAINKISNKGGSVQFNGPRFYNNVAVYAGMMLANQVAREELYKLYSLIDKAKAKKLKAQFETSATSANKKLIRNGQIRPEAMVNQLGKRIRYRGALADEALLMWINSENPTSVYIKSYYDHIKSLKNMDSEEDKIGTKIEIPHGECAFADLSAIISTSGGNNVIMTKVQGRDYSRKEMINADDMKFTVKGVIASNLPDVFPYEQVSVLLKLLKHKGIIQVASLAFDILNVQQVIITSWSLTPNEAFKNMQPYQFECVAVEPEAEADIIQDTLITANNQMSELSKDTSWVTKMLNKLIGVAANEATTAMETGAAKLSNFTTHV